MFITRTILVLCAVTALLALPAGAGAQQATLNGTATLNQLQGIAPAGAMLTVVLREFKSGAATAIATQSFPVGGKPTPFSFAMTYDPARIDQNLDYRAEATYVVNGQERFRTTTQYPVLTKGNPTTVSMILYSVPLPNTSSGTWLLALAGLALALALGIHLLRARRRVDAGAARLRVR
jgi:LPXTG-motif cell wall-anchored protein